MQAEHLAKAVEVEMEQRGFNASLMALCFAAEDKTSMAENSNGSTKADAEEASSSSVPRVRARLEESKRAKAADLCDEIVRTCCIKITNLADQSNCADQLQ